jgi:hypothetical protein
VNVTNHRAVTCSIERPGLRRTIRAIAPHEFNPKPGARYRGGNAAGCGTDVPATAPATRAGWKSQHFCLRGRLPSGAGESIIFAIGFYYSRKPR